MSNKDNLFKRYCEDNLETFVEFHMVDIKRTETILNFKGKDINGNEIEVVLDSAQYKMGSGELYCNEEFTLKELGFGNEYARGEIYIKPRGKRDFMNVYDWL